MARVSEALHSLRGVLRGTLQRGGMRCAGALRTWLGWSRMHRFERRPNEDAPLSCLVSFAGMGSIPPLERTPALRKWV